MSKITQLPRCYQLSYDIENLILYLKIEKWLVPQIKSKIEADIPLLSKVFYPQYGGDKTTFTGFGEHGQDFGYKNSIKWHAENEYEITYKYAIAPAQKMTDDICETCSGEGRDFGHKCFHCKGTGKKWVTNKENHYSDAMMSLWPIIRLASYALLEASLGKKDAGEFWEIVKIDRHQMIHVEWSDTSGIHNCGICAWIDDRVWNYAKETMKEVEIKKISEAMQSVNEKIMSKEKEKYADFRFSVHENIYFQVPGSACTLGTTNHGLPLFGNFGKMMTDHNVDNRISQFYFIVGLAVLGDLFEESLTL